MPKLQPDRLTRDQADALLQALDAAIKQSPSLAPRLLDPWDALTEAMDKLRATRRRTEAAEQ
jgi:hypothetical protein